LEACNLTLNLTHVTIKQGQIRKFQVHITLQVNCKFKLLEQDSFQNESTVYDCILSSSEGMAVLTSDIRSGLMIALINFGEFYVVLRHLP
jgi:hypothetical protein